MTKVREIIDDCRYARVLDHGFVGLVDHMGDDAAIVQAARVSYGKGTKSVREDRDLIRYLMRHEHTSPFEMCELKFHVKLPIFVARQWIRHRMANTNEQSARYSILEDEFFAPELEDLKPQSKDNKQGRDGELPEEERRKMMDLILQGHFEAHQSYDWLIKNDLARELARIVLPLGTYTEMYWKIDLHNLFRFLKLRSKPTAQKEIRDYADAIYLLARPWFPNAFEAWEDYVRDAVTLSRMELDLLRKILNRDRLDEMIEGQRGDSAFAQSRGMSQREFKEFRVKFGV